MTGGMRRAFARMRAFVVRESFERELDAELASHVTLATDEYIAHGVDAAEAWRRALVDLGAVESAREMHRESRGLPPFLDILSQDVRFTFRTLRRDLAFTTIAVLIVAATAGYLPARRAATIDPIVALR